jgi:hypothetical protein
MFKMFKTESIEFLRLKQDNKCKVQHFLSPRERHAFVLLLHAELQTAVTGLKNMSWLVGIQRIQHPFYMASLYGRETS